MISTSKHEGLGHLRAPELGMFSTYNCLWTRSKFHHVKTCCQHTWAAAWDIPVWVYLVWRKEGEVSILLLTEKVMKQEGTECAIGKKIIRLFVQLPIKLNENTNSHDLKGFGIWSCDLFYDFFPYAAGNTMHFLSAGCRSKQAAFFLFHFFLFSGTSYCYNDI